VTISARQAGAAIQWLLMTATPRGGAVTKMNIKRIVKLLKGIEWSSDFCDEPACPYCLNRRWRGHTPDCELEQALAALIKEKVK